MEQQLEGRYEARQFTPVMRRLWKYYRRRLGVGKVAYASHYFENRHSTGHQVHVGVRHSIGI